MNNKFREQSLNRKSYLKFTSCFSVTCFKHVGLLWPISAVDRKQVSGYTEDLARFSQNGEDKHRPISDVYRSVRQRNLLNDIWTILHKHWNHHIYNKRPECCVICLKELTCAWTGVCLSLLYLHIKPEISIRSCNQSYQGHIAKLFYLQWIKNKRHNSSA